MGSSWQPWRSAMATALYGPGGFYLRPQGPQAHFRTSLTTSSLVARALLRLARSVDAALGEPAAFTVVEVGAGHAPLLAAFAAAGVPSRWRLVAVERSSRPPGLAARVEWRHDPPTAVAGVVVAHEYLDVVPVDVVEVVEGRAHLLEVAADGAVRPGLAPSDRDLAWLGRWWPLAEWQQGEPGWPRDDAWVALVTALTRGVAVAVDYDHALGSRPPLGSLTGYRRGRQVRPVPDGSCDLTAHVALDACATAGAALACGSTWLGRQHEALRLLGCAPSPDPPRDPALDPRGLGGFGWLLQGVDLALPPAFSGPRRR